MNCLKMRAASRTLFHFFKAPFGLKVVLHVQHVSFMFVEKNFLDVVAISILSVKFPS